MANGAVHVQMRGITKTFPGVIANKNVDLEIYTGEVHALLGENGAGKSTLMNVLAGLYRPDAGEILIEGQPYEFRSPKDAISHGIGMVHQHFKLVDVQTVAENIIIGMDRPRFFLNMNEVEKNIAALAEQYHLPVHPKAYIWQLSVGEQQRVEILKMLYRGADVLILDEPTAVLTPQEVDWLFGTIRQLTAQGKSVVFITHKLNEVMDVANRITVLRDGQVVGKTSPTQTNHKELATMMVGREILIRLDRKAVQPGEVVLDAKDLVAQNDRGLQALKGMSFSIRRGEILGIAGVAGNGQRELAEVLTGMRKLKSGRIEIEGRDMTNATSRQIIDQRVSHVPEDRLGEGLIPNLEVADNEILKNYRSQEISKGPFLVHNAVTQLAKNLIEAFDIEPRNPQTAVRLLSGGNQQKVLLARELQISPNLLVAVHPTRGLDIGATEFVRKRLLEQREEGTGILLISEDLEEILALSDRVAVMYEGKIMGIVPIAEVDVPVLGMMMAGTPQGEVM